MPENRRMTVIHDLHVTVQERDVTEARAAWLAAENGGAPPARVEELLDDYARLVRARAAQQAERT